MANIKFNDVETLNSKFMKLAKKKRLDFCPIRVENPEDKTSWVTSTYEEVSTRFESTFSFKNNNGIFYSYFDGRGFLAVDHYSIDDNKNLSATPVRYLFKVVSK